MNMKPILLLLAMLAGAAMASESVCYGTTSNGRLENGVRLPSEGRNFVAYSSLAGLLGRTYVHSTVKAIVVDAYADLYRADPAKVYKYAETGYEEGGRFKPHKTHQNGLSVDFMVPVTDADGKSVHLPTNPLNKYGYNIGFDKSGHYDDYTIDFESMAAHIVSLHKEAKKRGVDLWRVIFAPELQPYLFKTKYGSYLKANVRFSKKRAWVRHDEHYHVDFAIPCK
jgi:penicillin-insensitive murein endopeptidase